ncbi:cytochrome c family protein [Hyphomonas neptunium ATCC 15444]|uniref:Cytochrome c family protein n=2 Tax=Hyphomonas TaxID=85 RepID=Q0BZJ6_HYPNA|nr:MULTISPECIES: cytochrome c [Hyphomonas]ABI78797.1 cytochrome c family protein [Hyphomonas neptunium ATCC 15444]KCZ95187.1 cytochrome c family protein [Hyphomonas hirschiana VP5]
MAVTIAKSQLAGIAMLAGALACLPACSREAGDAPAPSASEPATLPGEQIATDLCAGCHAVGLEGESPHTDAPPFRQLSEKYPVRYLEEALAEGISVGHEDMPEFTLEADQVEQLIVYLESIQAQ